MLILAELSTIYPYFPPHSISYPFYERIRGYLKNRERVHASVPLTRAGEWIPLIFRVQCL
jgi:hypothetical protein